MEPQKTSQRGARGGALIQEIKALQSLPIPDLCHGKLKNAQVEIVHGAAW